MTSERGYALVVALWLVALLSTITASYHAAARAGSKVLAQDLRRAQAEARAEAGVWIAAYEHFAHSPGNLVSRAFSEHMIRFGGAEVVVTIADAAGKINLNAAPQEVIASLIAAAGVPPSEQPALVDSILDWRDPDHVELPYGAEDGHYAAAGAAYGASDAPFATVDELRLVRGMTDPVYRRISHLLTVHGNERRVNLLAASADVLRALPGADERGASEVLRLRTTKDVSALLQSTTFDRRFVQARDSDIYVITSTAREGDVVVRIVATVRYARGQRELLDVLDWES